MARGIEFKLHGAEDVQRRLLLLPLKVQKKLVNKTLRQAGKLLKAAARPNIPVGNPRRRKTGKNLRNSLMVRSLTRKQRGRGGIGIRVITGRRAKLGIGKGENYYYPAAVELGFVHKRSGKKIRGKKYFRITKEQKEDKIKSMIVRVLREEVRKF